MHIPDSPYETLGVKKDEPKEKIKKRFRKLAKRLHPDQGGNEKEFIKAREAYRILIDDDLRSYYDKTGTIKAENNDVLIERTAMQTLSGLFMNLIENEQTSNKDILKSIKMNMLGTKPNLQSEIMEIKTKIKKWERIKNRIIFKGEGIDFITSAIGSRIALMYKEIEAKEFDLKVIQKILLLIDYYEILPSMEKEDSPLKKMEGFATYVKFTTGGW